MTKMIEINSCLSCKHINKHPFFKFCNKLGQHLTKDEVIAIPVWCTLPDAPEEDDKQ